ncbi:MAG: IPTL-CTERM sorting domain-containing protein [Thiobacillus sp.]|nr:IPTL-CTERM sorting domain-containing protein [Thiobacillus sp.]
MELGAAISDSATLSDGGTGGGAPTGTIAFNLYGPNDATCTGAAIFTSPVVVNGNGVYASLPFTPSGIGTYRWIAHYGGNSNHLPTTNICNAPNESVAVTAAPPTAGIPTLSEWVMILLASLMAIVRFPAMRRQANLKWLH